MRKRIIILGSTGSIGVNALRVARAFRDKFKVVGLSTHTNTRLLLKQIEEFSPRAAVVAHPEAMRGLVRGFGKTQLLRGEEGLKQLVALPADVILLAISGASALMPLLEAIDNKIPIIALANKESLVMAGAIIMKRIIRKRLRLLPVDSEQSAIFQCLQNQDRSQVSRIFLTASGGPLYDMPLKAFNAITCQQVLRHPRWQMGPKVTVDSATLMNKGLEAIETTWLFSIPIDKIQVLIHREAIVHSMVEFRDGSVLAQLGATDMRLPIQYALTFPERWSATVQYLDFFRIKALSFARPEVHKFPCLRLALEAAHQGGTLPCVLNAANEVAVEAFLQRRLSFTRIADVIEKVLSRHRRESQDSLEDILASDRWAREEARRILGLN